MLYRNRFYHTGLGRFVQRDPIGYRAGDVSLYRYVENVPITYFDPFGKSLISRNPNCDYHRCIDAAQDARTACNAWIVPTAAFEVVACVAACMLANWLLPIQINVFQCGFRCATIVGIASALYQSNKCDQAYDDAVAACGDPCRCGE